MQRCEESDGYYRSSDVEIKRLTPFVLIVGFWMFNQHGPIIFRFRTNSSNALVLVPYIRSILGLWASSGIMGSENQEPK